MTHAARFGGPVEPIVIRDDPERAVSIRLALEGVVMTESWFAGDERGPDPHVHRAHADCFYVLDGSLVLELADGDHRLPARSFALVPPGVVHAFRTGPEGARFLNLHVPGLGFDRYLRTISGAGGAFDGAEFTGFDQQQPPADGGRDPAHAIHRTWETAVLVEKPGEQGHVLATAPETQGALGLVERIVQPGAPGPPLHVHDRTTDAFLVLEGTFAVRIEGERHVLAAGDLAVAAPGVVHGATEAIGGPARLLNLLTPAGLEAVYVDPMTAATADVRLV